MPLALLRKHWLLILLIVVGLLWWHIVDLLTPTLFEFNPPLKNVDYWSLMSNPTLETVAMIGFIGIGIFTLIQISRVSGIAKGFILVILVLLACMISTFSSATFSKSQTTLRHVMSIQYQGKEYHLTLATDTEPFDMTSYSYWFFECDESGRTCSKIINTYLMSNDTRNDHLIVLNNKLILDRGFDQTQILPAVNGSS